MGENGSGKSTILDALCFSLFGKPFRKVNKSQLVNTVNGKECAVEIEFYAKNQHYRVVRTINSTTNSGGDFDVYENGEEINKGSKKDVQEFLEKNILRLNFHSFTQVVILGSTTFVPFMQLSAGKRREVIEDLLDIRVFTAMNVLLKERVQSNKEKISECKNRIDVLKEKLEVHKKYAKELQETNEEKIEELENEIETNRKTIEEHEKEIKDNESKIKEYDVGEDEYKPKIDKLQHIESQIESKKKSANKEIEFYQSSNSCPTCLQDIDESFKSKKIEEKKHTLEELDQGLQSLKEKMRTIESQREEFLQKKAEVEELQSQNQSLRHKISSIEQYVKRLERDLQSLQEKSGSIEDENGEIEKIERKIGKFEDALSQLYEKKKILDAAAEMLKDKGIKTQVIKQYVPVINRLVNQYLASLDFFVNFELDENFNETIRSRHRDDFSYDSFSEGEKARIDLSLLFAWRAIAKMKNSAATNLLILDEVFDGSLDATGQDDVSKILSTIEEDTNVFVISHKTDSMIDQFDNVLRFEKDKNFTRMTME